MEGWRRERKGESGTGRMRESTKKCGEGKRRRKGGKGKDRRDGKLDD